MDDSVIGTIIENILENTKLTQDKIKINSRKDEIGRSINVFLNEYDSNRKELLGILVSRSEKGKLNIVDEKGNIDIQKIGKIISYENEGIEAIKKESLMESEIDLKTEGNIFSEKNEEISILDLKTFEEKVNWVRDELGINIDDYTKEGKEVVINIQVAIEEHSRRTLEIIKKYNGDTNDEKCQEELKLLDLEYEKKFGKKYAYMFKLCRDENGNIVHDDKSKELTIGKKLQNELKTITRELIMLEGKKENEGLSPAEQKAYTELTSKRDIIIESMGMSKEDIEKYLRDNNEKHKNEYGRQDGINEFAVLESTRISEKNEVEVGLFSADDLDEVKQDNTEKDSESSALPLTDEKKAYTELTSKRDSIIESMGMSKEDIEKYLRDSNEKHKNEYGRQDGINKFTVLESTRIIEKNEVEVGVFSADDLDELEQEDTEKESEFSAIPLTNQEGDQAIDENGEEIDASAVDAAKLAEQGEPELSNEVEEAEKENSEKKPTEPEVVTPTVEEIHSKDVEKEQTPEPVYEETEVIKGETQLAVYKPRLVDRLRGFISDIKNVGVVESFNKNFRSDDVQAFGNEPKTSEEEKLKGIDTDEQQPNLAQDENIKKQTLLTKMKDSLKKAFGMKDETAEKLAEKQTEKTSEDSKDDLNGGFDFSSPNEELMKKTTEASKAAAGRLENGTAQGKASSAGPEVEQDEK